jgi:phosphopantothenoylcysteine synthetase/decarboxylase
VEERGTIEFIVTAGGTREPIDDVRFIGNASTGRLGAAVADAAFRRGHRIRFLHAEDSALPACADHVTLKTFRTASDLKDLLRPWVEQARPPAVVVHAAAVADYVPERLPGKTPSDRPEWVIRLKRGEKIVDYIKGWNPRVALVKFKLEVGRGREELLAIAREAGLKSGADWVVANDLRSITKDRHPAFLLDASGRIEEAATKAEIAEKLVLMIESAWCAGFRRQEEK